MRDALQIFAAETLKQRRRMSGSKVIFFSMLLWPLLELLTLYYTVLPVVGGGAIARRWPAAADPQSMLAFLATGSVGFSFYFALVQSAWHFSFERQAGTLELLFLSPARRLSLVVANGVGGLIQNVWLFVCLSVAVLALTDAVHVAHPAMFLVAFLALFVPSLGWGALLNGLLIFSRDSAFLFTILGEPMAFSGGARLPLWMLPGWIATVGTVLPLSGSLVVVRGAILDGKPFDDLAWPLVGLGVSTVVMLLLASLVLHLGERRAQRTGQLRLF
ncbi:ABC-2 type transport system permease protein [Micromonospora pisi]|uniref:ABC-2 type transport system permease protein n=1 Tax=Micromonospora pisi TaxID=589240 RepID=A0A495JRU5_9ACTN|nr:ABC transporter permease [Micromonospora pisi]RKR91084.1 ABC-2 type transport system permease protein [Micromonospora pisi]